MKINLVTFGGSAKNYHDAVERLCSQAKALDIFNNVYGFTEEYLINDKLFWNKHENFILNNKRGYGYWIWKPYIMLKTLLEMDDNDVLVYLDAGCEINIEKKYEFDDLIKKIHSKLIMTSKADSSDINYTKMDLIKFFNMENNIDDLKNPQTEAGAIVILKCEKTMKLIQEWYNICSDNYNLINDTQSKLKNFDNFVENRHDQSVLSLLLKKNKLNNYELNTRKKNLFWVARNRSGEKKQKLYYFYKKK